MDIHFQVITTYQDYWHGFYVYTIIQLALTTEGEYTMDAECTVEA